MPKLENLSLNYLTLPVCLYQYYCQHINY